ncbi:SNF2-related protein [Synechococcus sp. PCC 7336]|uniref:SNF2-related protein n=1 Tax=Synechococcus sp. PCC 7336 TaxID=195250 RepID=UPI000348022C|nr:SNF2-related protein [Synechococcus sp. PCC 7336]
MTNQNQSSSSTESWNPEIPHQEVRIRSNPGRRGLTTGKVRKAGTRILVQVQFGPNEKVYKPQNLLELCGDDDSIKSLFKQKRFGGPDDLRRILTYEKVKGKLTNVFYSMEASQTDFYAHQFKPVLKFLNSSVGRLLIADEVGLGKTIEAMYVWKELQARADARRLLIVCPAMLRQKWQDDLRQRFNIFAEIVNAKELVNKVRTCLETQHLQPLTCIVSLEGLRPSANWEDRTVKNSRAEFARLLDTNPATDDFGLFDLAIIDEAHYLRNASTANNRIGRLIRDASRHLLLLTATPIQVQSSNLYQLLRLVSPDDFFNELIFENMLEANYSIIQALRYLWANQPRLEQARAAIKQSMRSEYFKDNRLLHYVYNILQESEQIDEANRVELGYKLEKISLLNQYVTRSRKRDVLPNRVKRDPQTLNVYFSPLEQEIYNYVTQKIKQQTRGRQGVSLFRLIARQRQMASCMVAALQSWKIDGILGDLIDESLWEDFGISAELQDGEAEEQSPLDVVLTLLQKVNTTELEKQDSKYNRLQQFLHRQLQVNASEKFVIFAYFRGTLQYLERRLQADGISTCLIIGGMGNAKWDVINQFAEKCGPSVLLSSEVGSEGIDLQHCRFLVNYDLPWNPMRVEQRIGRLDRLGQKADRISIINFSLVDTVEERILERLYERINIFRESIGDLENILGETTEQLLVELFSEQLTPEEQEQRATETTMALLKERALQDELETEAINILAFSDRILQSITDSREQGRWLQPEELRTFVEDCFSRYYPGTVIVPKPNQDKLYEITLSEAAKVSLQLFLTQNRCVTPTQLHLSSIPIACFFDSKIAGVMGKRNELLDSTHPLILWIRHRYETAAQKLHPISATQIDQQIVGLPLGIYVYVVCRWTFIGLKTENKIGYQVACYSNSKLLSDRVSEFVLAKAMQQGGDKPNAHNFIDDLDRLLDLHQKCEDFLEDSFGKALEEFEIENENHCNIQERSARAFAERKQRELEDRIQRFKQAGKTQIIPATEGQLRKVNRELEVKLKSIQEKREGIAFEQVQLASGVIFVEP